MPSSSSSVKTLRSKKRLHSDISSVIARNDGEDKEEAVRKVQKVEEGETPVALCHHLRPHRHQPFEGDYIVNHLSIPEERKGNAAFVKPHRILTFDEVVYVEFVVKSKHINRDSRSVIPKDYGSGCCGSLVPFTVFDNRMTPKEDKPRRGKKMVQPKYDDVEHVVGSIICPATNNFELDGVLREAYIRVVFDTKVTVDAAVAAVEQILSHPICPTWTMWIGDQRFEKYTCGKEMEDDFYNGFRRRGNLLQYRIVVVNVSSDPADDNLEYVEFPGDHCIHIRHTWACN